MARGRFRALRLRAKSSSYSKSPRVLARSSSRSVSIEGTHHVPTGRTEEEEGFDAVRVRRHGCCGPIPYPRPWKVLGGGGGGSLHRRADPVRARAVLVPGFFSFLAGDWEALKPSPLSTSRSLLLLLLASCNWLNLGSWFLDWTIASNKLSCCRLRFLLPARNRLDWWFAGNNNLFLGRFLGFLSVNWLKLGRLFRKLARPEERTGVVARGREQFPVGMRVLAVDDDPVCLKVLETLLLRCQYNGMLDMLLDTELETAQRDYAQTAQVYGKALISLINKALGRAKIEANKLELESVT